MDRDTKIGARIDDQLKHEVEPLTRSGMETRSDESRIQEDIIDRPLEDGDAVAQRSNLARFLDPSIFPADRKQILASAQQNNALEWVLRSLDQLPDDSTYENFESVWEALGGAVEERF